MRTTVNNKIVLVDVDDTIANTRQAMLKYYRDATGDYSTSIEGSRTYWYTDTMCPLFSDERANIAFNDPRLFNMMEPLEGAIEGVKYLQNKGYEVRICTLHQPLGIALKDMWLDYYFPNITKRHYSTTIGDNKDVFKAYSIIDDSLKNIHTSPCDKPILLDYFKIQDNGLYLKEDKRTRVTGWKEIIERGIL